MIAKQRLFNIAEGVFRRLDASGFENLSKAEQVFATVWLLDFEVCNGGFSQFFHNSSGKYADSAIVALDAIGAPTVRSLLRQAIEVIGGSPSQDAQERQKQILELPEFSIEMLDNLDSEYYRDADGIEGLLLAFAEREGLGDDGLG